MKRTWTIIGVRDVPSSFNWYQSLLGQPKTPPGHDYFGQILDTDGTVLLCLHQWGAHEHPTLMSPDPASPGNGLLLFFRVDDYEMSLKRACALVDRFEEEPHVNPNTQTREFSLRDPDGYYVTISELSPPAKGPARGMSEILAGKVQAGLGNASHWLKLFNAAYSEKLGMSVFPGSLNVALDHVFDWFDARYEAHRIWLGREDYGGERDILLLRCQLVSLDHRRGFLWTPTTAARDRRDPWVVEIANDVNLRDHFGLQDGDVVEISVPISGL